MEKKGHGIARLLDLDLVSSSDSARFAVLALEVVDEGLALDFVSLSWCL